MSDRDREEIGRLREEMARQTRGLFDSREIALSNLAALRAEVAAVRDEIRDQASARYDDLKYEEGASTMDLQAWADRLTRALDGRE